MWHSLFAKTKKSLWGDKVTERDRTDFISMTKFPQEEIKRGSQRQHE